MSPALLPAGSPPLLPAASLQPVVSPARRHFSARRLSLHGALVLAGAGWAPSRHVDPDRQEPCLYVGKAAVRKRRACARAWSYENSAPVARRETAAALILLKPGGDGLERLGHLGAAPLIKRIARIPRTLQCLLQRRLHCLPGLGGKPCGTRLVHRCFTHKSPKIASLRPLVSFCVFLRKA